MFCLRNVRHALQFRARMHSRIGRSIYSHPRSSATYLARAFVVRSPLHHSATHGLRSTSLSEVVPIDEGHSLAFASLHFGRVQGSVLDCPTCGRCTRLLGGSFQNSRSRLGSASMWSAVAADAGTAFGADHPLQSCRTWMTHTRPSNQGAVKEGGIVPQIRHHQRGPVGDTLRRQSQHSSPTARTFKTGEDDRRLRSPVKCRAGKRGAHIHERHAQLASAG